MKPKEVKLSDKKYNSDNTLHLYLRVSSEVQVEGGVGIDLQKNVGIKRSKELGLNWCIHNEGGKSSFSDTLNNRPIMRNLLDGMDKKIVKHLYVYNTDRLSRKRTTWYLIRLKIQNSGVQLYIGEGTKVDSQDKLESLMLGILSEISQYDNEVRRDRSRLGKIEKFKRGLYIHGTTPFGYSKLDMKLIPHETNNKILRKMFQKYSRSNSIKEIGDWLTSEQIRTPRGNIVWTTLQIRNMLRSRHYNGETSFHDKISNRTYSGSCPKLIEDKLWYDVQKKLEFSSTVEQQRRKIKHDYLLTSYLFCGVCGHLMRGVNKPKKYTYLYYCGEKENRWRDGRIPKCDRQRSKSVNVKKMDDLVWETLLDTIEKSNILKQDFKDKMMGVNLEVVDNKELEINNIISRKKQNKRKLNQQKNTLENNRLDLQKRFYLDEIKKDDYMEIGLELDLKIDRINSDIEELESDIKKLNESSVWIDWITKYGDKVEKYRRMKTIKEKQQIVGQFLLRIEVDYDVEKQFHNVKLKSRIPLFDDGYVVVGQDRYGRRITKIKDGTTTKTVKIEKSKYDSSESGFSKKKDQNDEAINEDIVEYREHPPTKTVRYCRIVWYC